MAEMTVTERFGARVRAAREEKGITPVQMAWRTKLSLELLESIEAGQYEPDLEEIDHIAKALGVPMSSLLDGLRSDGAVQPPVASPPLSPLHRLVRAAREWLSRR